jgi:glycosyltransferase involved in cell wall biosynthesis
VRPLRIALTVDPYLPVPPVGYGGIERLVDLLARGLVERGHDVTLLAHPDSHTAGRLAPYGVPPHDGRVRRARELWQVGSALWRRRRELDVVHSAGRLAALLPILPLRSLPKIQTYQRDQVPWSSVRAAVRMARESIAFVGCSDHVCRARPEGDAWGRWHRIHNAIELDRYRFVAQVAPDAPLAFLGRLERLKGAHNAVAIARAAGRRLVIAGNRVAADGGYFARDLRPLLDGENVRWVGELDDAGKSELLSGAAALLMPVEWDEPFGLVMIEALACGTPVIGFPRGAVPEVVRDDETGFLCRSVDEAAAAVGRLGRIDRRRARADCEARFSARCYVDAYEALYFEMVARRR